MKKILLLIAIVFLFNCAKTPNKLTNYSKVIEYVNNIEPYKKEGVYVVDSLFYISKLYLNEDLLKGKNSSRGLEIIDSLENEDKKKFYSKYRYEGLRELNTSEKAKYNLYFSKQSGNIINFEILDNQGDINNTHNFLSMFGVGYIYSVEISDKGKVRLLKKIEILYN